MKQDVMFGLKFWSIPPLLLFVTHDSDSHSVAWSPRQVPPSSIFSALAFPLLPPIDKPRTKQAGIFIDLKHAQMSIL